jgi:glycosyltransferase involved in cell wall biosynthesis
VGERLVSVVLPTKDRAGTILPAITSVLHQGYDHLELIVVDDGSTDGTSDVLATVDDPRFSSITLTVGLGPAGARNVALARAKGEVIAFQDSDDVWTDDHLDVLLGALPSPPSEVGLAYGVVRYPTGRLVPGPNDVERDGDLTAVLARYNIIGLPACIVRADVLDEVGWFDPVLPRLEDWDLFLRIATARRIAFVDQIVLEAGDSGPRVSTDVPGYFTALASILDKHRALYGEVGDCRVAYEMQLARYALREGRLGVAARRVAASLQDPSAAATWFAQRVLRRRSPVDRGPT